jgi:hypothetical protein
MTIFELVARERARVAQLVRAEAWTRAAVVLVAALTIGALVLGGSRWIALPRILPFLIWAVAIAGAAYLVRRGMQALGHVAASGAIADAVEREQKMRRGAVRGIVELAEDKSAFVARAAQRLGETLGARGHTLAPALQLKLRRGALVAVSVFAPVVLIAVFVGAKRPDDFRALAHPVDAWRGALLPRLQISDAPTRALRGSTLKLTVRAAGRSIVSLRRRTTGNAWVETALVVTDGTVSTELGPLDADLTLVASDGRAVSDTVVVRIVDRPFLGDVAVRATYPAYLHRASEALPGDLQIRVPKGTELAIEGHASEALASVWLVQGRDSLKLVPAEKRFSGHFTPSASGSWAWSAHGASAAIADVPPPLTVEVVPDSAPVAEILQPASDSLVLPTAKIEMQLLASDDHGLQSVILKTWRVARDGKAQPPTSANLAGGGIPDWAGVVAIDLGKWTLEPGDAVHVQLVARDESPAGQEGLSRELILRVPANEEQRAAARAAGDSAAARATAMAKAQAGLQQRTSDAARGVKSGDKSKPGDPMQYEGAQQAKALAAEQKAMASQMQQLQQASKALEDRLRAAGALDTNLSAQLREAQKLLREALTPEMLEALKKLDNSAQQLSGDQAKQSLQQLADQQKKMREALEKSAEILKRAALEGSMQTLKDEAAELSKAERARADSAKGQQLPDDAKRLQDRTQQLQKDLQQLEERLKAENADPAARKADEAMKDVQEAMKALDPQAQQSKGGQGQQKDGEQLKQSGGQQQNGQGSQGGSQGGQQNGQMNKAGDNSGKPQGGKPQAGQQGQEGGQGSQQGAKQAADAMDRASKALGEGRKQQVDEWKSELTGELDQSLQEMLQLARQQDGLADKAKKNPMDPNLRGEESALQQGVEKASERLGSQAKRSALVSPRSTRAMSDAEQKVQQAARDAGDPRTASQASQSMSEAANALRQTAAALARDRERAGNSQSASGLPELLAQLQALAQQQGSLNGQMQSLVQQAGAKQGGQGVSPEMQSSARSLAKSQRDVANQLDEVGDADASGRAAELAREARQLAQTLEQGAVDPTVLERQQRLFRRMLDAGHTLENDQKEESGKRESRPGDQNNPFLPQGSAAAGKTSLKYRVPEWNELRGLSADERRLVIEYFRRLNGDKP